MKTKMKMGVDEEIWKKMKIQDDKDEDEDKNEVGEDEAKKRIIRG